MTARPPPMDRIITKDRGPVMPQRPAPARLQPHELSHRLAAGAVLVDTRDPRAFGAGHVAGCLNVWIDGPQFGERVSWFVTPGASLLLLTETDADAARAVPALARVGLDDVAGYVPSSAVQSSGLPVGTLANVTPQELAQRLAHERDLVVLDVREPAEWTDGHMPGALHVPMRQVAARLAEIPRDRRSRSPAPAALDRASSGACSSRAGTRTSSTSGAG